MIVRRLDENHDMTFGHGMSDMARDDEATAQCVQTRLYLILGEWFLDTGAGVPWLTQIMTKPANLPLAEAILKRTILQTEGVASLNSFNMIFNSETRRLDVQAVVTNIYGTTFNIKVTK